jgi:quinoprotein glucose dehydrogenase
LAFDEYGNLFTGDNNSDSGDQARWVQVVEGGDSGWRIGFQYLEQPYSRGPWNAEKMWHPANEEQPAYIVPPLANIASGPSGLTYYPGTGMPERYLDHFFLCDFRGDSGRSGIHSFALKPAGATFEVVDHEEFLWSLLVTDCDFAPDGGLYVSDWVEGWAKPTKGRIYRVTHAEASQEPIVAEVERLIGEGVREQSADELAALLAHADMRVRQLAQFELAARGESSIGVFAAVAAMGGSQIARIHALWGLEQIARGLPEAIRPATALLSDDDAEVRAQAAKVCGEARADAAYEPLVTLLSDAEPRVRFFAAQALGKLGRVEAVPAVFDLLRDNADGDRYLRHAGVMALTALADSTALAAAATDASPAVRRGALLALRRQGSVEVARFLDDADPTIVAEAARAIYDEPIPDGLPRLAALATRQGLPETLLWRALCANFRLGGEENAQVVAAAAARSDVPEVLRLEALRQLAEWEKPSGRDRVTGLWRPIEPRAAGVANGALQRELPGIFAGPDAVRQEAAGIAASLGIEEVGPLLFDLLAGESPPAARVAALDALDALHDERLPAAVELALADDEGRLRAAGRRLRAKADPTAALPLLEDALAGGETIERQQALAVLGDLDHPRAAEAIAASLELLLAGELSAELQLDLLAAAAARPEPAVSERLARFEATRRQDDPLGQYREALQGGDGERGGRIFFDRAEVSCLRCHKVGGRGGDVGPDLSTIAARKDREYLLRSLVDPNLDVAQGFESLIVEMDDGLVHAGIFKEETAAELRLMTPEGMLLVLPAGEIVERARGKSAMPDTVLKSLTKSEIRDVVEFLAGLRGE